MADHVVNKEAMDMIKGECPMLVKDVFDVNFYECTCK